MIDFITQNPSLIQVSRDGAHIGWLNRTKDPISNSPVWSGIVDSKTFRPQKLCQVKQQIHDILNDRDPDIDLTSAGRQALRDHGPMQRAKVQAAATRGAKMCSDVSQTFRLASQVLAEGDADKALAMMATVRGSLQCVLKAMDFAGVTEDAGAD